MPEESTSTTFLAVFGLVLVFSFGFAFESEVDGAVWLLRCLPFPLGVGLVLRGGSSTSTSVPVVNNSESDKQVEHSRTWRFLATLCWSAAAFRCSFSGLFA
jgi:formate/nitrite transporter FocA (FNT family)